MRLFTFLLAGSMTLGFAAEAAAGPGQCFAPNNQPVGPVYETDSPNYAWLEWAERRGLYCRRIAAHEAAGLRNRYQAYPPEFAAASAPGYRPHGSYNPPGNYPPPGYRPPGPQQPETGWYGDPGRATFLVNRWLAHQGRPYAQVVDTGRIEYLYERQWRIFFARWNDGSRARIAVRYSRREGNYVAMQSYGGGTWAQPQPIGQ